MESMKKRTGVVLGVLLMAALLLAVLPTLASAWPSGLYIEFGSESIGNFEANANYDVRDASSTVIANVSSDALGYVSIAESWLGQTLTFTNTSTNVVSSPFAIGTRPAAPGASATMVSARGASDGSIALSGTAPSGFEYRAGTSGSWTNVTGNTITGLAAGTYQVRIKAHMGAEFFLNFASEIATAEVRSPVCKIVQTNIVYATIDDALAAVANGQTIVLLTDVTLSGSLTINNGRTFTFDTDGYTLDFDGNALSVNIANVTFDGCSDWVNLIWIDAFSHAIFNGNLTLYDGCLYVEDAVVTVDGNLTTLDDDGIDACYGAQVTVNGNINAHDDAVDAWGGSRVTVNGNITTTRGTGVYAEDAGTIVTVTGNITAEQNGISAFDGAAVTLTGNIAAGTSSSKDGIRAAGGATVTMTGNITAAGDDGIQAEGAGTSVTLTGDISGVEYGIYTPGDGATVVVNGNVTAVWSGIYGDSDSTITVNGNVTGVRYGIHSYDKARIVVNGTVTGEDYGVCAHKGSLITVSGTITAKYIGVSAVDVGTAVFAKGDIVVTGTDATEDIICGVISGFGGQVTVDGTITALNYIGFYVPESDIPIFVTKADYDANSLKAGYLQYSDNGDPISFVWVKDTATPPGPGPDPKPLPPTGDATPLQMFTAPLLALVNAGMLLAWRRRETF